VSARRLSEAKTTIAKNEKLCKKAVAQKKGRPKAAFLLLLL
jgi:hypothetical protein